MKKLLLVSTLVASLFSFNTVKADTASATIISGTMTNIFTGYGKINSIVLTGTTSTNVGGLLVDSTTNSTVFVTTAYTNILSYITNLTSGPGVNYTNYFGVITTLTNSSGNNYVLVDVTNSVAANTNTLVNYQLNVAGNSTVLVNPANINIIRGAWFTNTSSGTISVLLNYNRQ